MGIRQLCTSAFRSLWGSSARRRQDSLESNSAYVARRTSQNLQIEPLESRQLLATLAGTVFADINGNNTQDAAETSLAGILITLNGVDESGEALASRTTVTGSNGSYQFADLVAGTYTVTQAQPKALVDGVALVGSFGGTSGPNTISNIVLGEDDAAVNYNFTEKGFGPSSVSINLFLASAGSGAQALNNAVASAGSFAPFVTSITRG
ncbi:MAG: SdrD B-like domain-containing protein, partial [Planctomycetota bacterium]|nr:SdrD B-like domain-containing protein [Planctomycetota bacterium]